MPSHGRLVGLLAAVFVLLAGSAMLRTSITFDEIVFPAAGARALHTGDFGMVKDHPRLPQVLFGLPVYLSGVNYPAEQGYDYPFARYHYARTFFWASGNSAAKITVAARLVGLAFGTFTVLATFLLARRHMPSAAALLAAALVAFMPDMLAHSGVAYTDVPLAFFVLVGVYAFDAAVRNPAPGRAAVAGLVFALAVCTKFSGLILAPAALALLVLEASSGRVRDAAWRAALVRALAVFTAVAYAVIVAMYGGDWRLAGLAAGLEELSRTTLIPRPAFLLGESRVGGWWYFYPVAFALKTPAGFHVLAAIALAAGFLAARRGAWREWALHGARAPATGAALMLAAAMASHMNIGMRHALPLLPLACILVAQGIAWAWARGARALRGAVALCLVALVASSVSRYPYFLSYVSEYAAGRPLYRTLVDSSTDWGQGLVGLRDFMRERRIERVALGYFGSALPDGYGIEYVALPSYFTLPREAPGGPAPRYVVVSATLLAGSYVADDPYAQLRGETPVAVVGGSLYVFDREAARR